MGYIWESWYHFSWPLDIWQENQIWSEELTVKAGLQKNFRVFQKPLHFVSFVSTIICARKKWKFPNLIITLAHISTCKLNLFNNSQISSINKNGHI